MDKILLFLKTHISTASINSVALVIKLLEKLSMLKSIFTKKTVVITSVLILILSSTLTVLMFTVIYKYEISDFIEIRSNEDVYKYSFPGDGSEQNPFLIEGLKFKSNEEFDLRIHNTNYSFIIRNCLFTNTEYCLRLYNCRSGSISVEDNTFKVDSENHKYSRSTTMQDSSNITIKKNKFLGYSSILQFGIWYRNCSDVLIQENYFNLQDFHFGYGQDLIIDNNQFETEDDFSCIVKTFQITNVTISSNRNSKGRIAFGASQCREVKIFNNTLTKGDFFLRNDEIEDYYTHYVENNKIACRDYGFLVNISNLELTSEFSKIHLIQSSNVTINNQNLNDISSGVRLEFCSNSSIVNSTISDTSADGIEIYYSNNTLVSGNQILRTRSQSIYISSSRNTTILNNTINDSYENGEYEGYQHHYTRSIEVIDSPYSTIENNVVSSNRCSLKFENSPYSSIISNRFNSIDIDSLDINTMNIVNNSLNNKELGIFINQNNFSISSDYSQFIVVNCSKVSIESESYNIFEAKVGLFHSSSYINISYCSFTSTKRTYCTALRFDNCTSIQFRYVEVDFCDIGISIANSNNTVFKSLTVRNSYDDGIECYNVHNITFEDSYFINCRREGLNLIAAQNIMISNAYCESSSIWISNSNNITLQNSEFRDCLTCIYTEDSTMISILNNSFNYEFSAIAVNSNSGLIVYCNIINNTLVGGFSGINLGGISSPVLIERNAVFNNTLDKPWGKSQGIYAKHCEDLTITNNYIGYNSRGIFLESSSYSNISLNNFDNNFGYAIELSKFSHNNLIFMNNFYDNNINGDFQAYDEGEDNKWNSDDHIGNYWSNCIKQDNCKIDGEALTYDYNPLDTPVDIPYNASYFNIEVSESSYSLEIFTLILAALTIGVIQKRRKHNDIRY